MAIRPWLLPADEEQRNKVLERLERLEKRRERPSNKNRRRMTGAEYKAALEKRDKAKPKKEKD